MMKSRSYEKKKTDAGFTLVELIVVLVVLGILATAAVFGVIGYINYTRFNKNQENADSIYQSAQSAVTHMSENGTLEDWVVELITDQAGTQVGTIDLYNADNHTENDGLYDSTNKSKFEVFPNDFDKQRGLSIHMRYEITYLPGGSGPQNDFVYDLISNDFKSTDIFSGVITIEFDIEKKLDANGKLHYGANVISVFYDSRRTSWDEDALNSVNYPSNTLVPFRDETYRRNTSYVGYFCADNGTAAVDNVYVPTDTEIKDVIFTLRNGETLDMTWSALSQEIDPNTGKPKPITGKPAHIHYTFTLYDYNTDNPFCYLVVNENSIADRDSTGTDWQPNGMPKKDLNDDSFYDILRDNLYNTAHFDKNNFSLIDGATSVVTVNNHSYAVVYTKENVTDEHNAPLTIYKASIQTTAKVYVHKVTSPTDSFDYDNAPVSDPLEGNNYYSFPLTISYEVYDLYGNTLSERISYTLSLDAMMSKNLVSVNETNGSLIRTHNYSISRLYGTGNGNKLSSSTPPKNMYAKMAILPDNFRVTMTDYNYQPTEGTFSGTGQYIAERALDDPAYLLTDGKTKTYRYRDNHQLDYGKGYAVVNTLFGDIEYGSMGSDKYGSDGNVVITSFRHLYNIRFLTGTKNSQYSGKITYSIKRDLNWFSIYTNGGGTETYSSDVVVYTAASSTARLVGNSPVPVPLDVTNPTKYPSDARYGDYLNVVSFPSLPMFNGNATLIAEDNALSNASDPTSVINNVQMRMASFYKNGFGNASEIANDLNGYGLINVNYGKVVNIRANGLTLTLSNVPDGSPDDRNSGNNSLRGLAAQILSKDSSLIVDSPDILFNNNGSSPIGGLIGANNGLVGDPSSSAEYDKAHNTVRFSNCIVTSACWNGAKWQVYKISALGGIIGDNNTTAFSPDGSVFGYIEATGNFMCAGRIDVGSVIGYTQSSVNAFVYVDNTNEKYNDTPIVKFDNVGTTEVHSVIYAATDSVGGAIGCAGPSKPESTLTLFHLKRLDDHLTPTVTGGAVSFAPDTATYAVEVKLDEGSFIIMKTNESPKYDSRPTGIGGAIGRIWYCKESENVPDGKNELGIRVINNGYIISSEGTTWPKHVGGAIGIITNCSFDDMELSVTNNGNIGPYSVANTSSYVRTTGGAVGLLSSATKAGTKIRILTINNGQIYGNCSNVTSASKNPKIGGIGGAIGAFTGSKTTLPVLTVRSYNNGSIEGNTSVTSDIASVGVGGVCGFVEFMPKNSAFYCVNAADSVVKATGKNAGGCIGAQTGTFDSDTEIKTTVLADLYSGAAIESTSENAGGAIGNIEAVYSKLTVEAVVRGDVTINAGSNAGGVCGHLNTRTDSDTSTIRLRSTGTHNITIKASENNAGGLIGEVYSNNNNFALILSMPTQESGDELVILVDSKNNAGGLIGHFKNSKDTTSNLSVVFNSKSHVYAEESNAGGVIGLLESGGEFKSIVSVKDPTIVPVAIPEVKAGVSNAGGCVGSTNAFKQHEDSIIAYESCMIAIKCEKDNGGTTEYGGNVGGCIGSITGSTALYGSVLMKGPDPDPNATAPAATTTIAITGKNNIGGCIGYCENSVIGKNVTAGMANLQISGEENIGGCIGCISGVQNNTAGSIGTGAEISFTSENSAITGNTHTGGCIGLITDNNGVYGNVLGKIIFEGKNATITGTLQDAGGTIGAVEKGSFQDNSYVIFNGDTCTINGAMNTGGVIGRVNRGEAKGNAYFTFTGDKTTITGTTSVGGIIGGSISYSNRCHMLMKPATYCNITGEENVGGCVGLAKSNNKDTGSKDTANLANKPKIELDNCVMTITGSGNTGGILGQNVERSWFSGGYINVPEGSSMNITSSGSAAGGIVGYLDSTVNFGSNTTVFSITCNGSITVKGYTAAGGLIGRADKNTGSNNSFNTFTLSIKDKDSFKVQATGGTDAAAGGLVGINYDTFGKNASYTINIKMTITSSGKAGALVGSNEGSEGVFFGNANNTVYNIDASVNGSGTVTASNAKDFLFGKPGTYYNFKFTVNGSTYSVNGSGVITATT